MDDLIEYIYEHFLDVPVNDVDHTKEDFTIWPAGTPSDTILHFLDNNHTMGIGFIQWKRHRNEARRDIL